MKYGPTSKQLAKIARKINLLSLPPETLDPDGWFVEGKRDAEKGRDMINLELQHLENWQAYRKGYSSGLK